MNNTAILCIHGFMGYPEEFNILKSLFTKLNYDTYTFVLSRHHNRKLKNATRGDWEKDCINNIEMIKNKGYKNIIIVGHSMGGVLATMMSKKYSKYISKLILIDPSFEYLVMKNNKLKIIPSIKTSKTLLKEINELNKQNYSKIISCSLSSLKEFHHLVKEHNNDIYEIKCPILFLRGEKDCVVPLKSIHNIYEKIDNINNDFITVKNGSHWFFSSKQDDIIYEQITKFLNKKILIT